MNENIVHILAVGINVFIVAGMGVYVMRSVRGKRKPDASTFLGKFVVLSCLAGVLLVAAAFIWAWVQIDLDADRDAVPVTEANNPANVLLALTPDTSVQELYALAEKYGCTVSGSGVSGLDDTWTHYRVTVGDANAARYLFHADSDKGAALEVYYSSDAPARLLHAYLQVRTDDGFAACAYTPADGAYALTLRPGGALLTRHETAETARQAVDAVYAAVYP